jgi:hypothetical protein
VSRPVVACSIVSRDGSQLSSRIQDLKNAIEQILL